MEGIQGAVLGVKLKYLNEWTEKRRAVAARYKELLADIEQVVLPKEMPYAKHVYHLFVIRIREEIREKREEKRNGLMRYLNENGVATGLHYPVPLHLQNCFKYLGYKNGDFPMSEELAETGLSLPMFPEMSVEQTEYVCDKIKAFFKI
jgi:dTDP-4-amino-4,6-dideoxygalactose transaminase